ncbi:MAG TPA: hypothetical protein PLJ88_12845 [Agitococcus sp.]|nr:hypothetical protein [Agitococcus sp.]
MKNLFIVIFLFTSFLTGCATTNQRVLDSGNETQLQKRSYQSRIFDTTDKEKVLRATISTIQDLGFVIDRADLVLGSVSGTKLDGHQIKITVSVRPKGSDRMLVRANAQFNITPIEDPKHYQDFFSSLEKSLFLVAHAGE